MNRSVHVNDLLADDAGPGGRLWAFLLLMAIRDKASSVHYHPWRADGPLSYIVDNVRHTLEPPHAEHAEMVVAAARSLIAPHRWLFADRRTTLGGSFALQFEGISVEWDVVCWSSGTRMGAEFFRVVPSTEASHAEPAAAPGPASTQVSGAS